MNRLWNGRFLMSWSHRNLRIRFSAKLLFLQKKLTTYRANSQHPQWQKKRFGWICGSVLLYVKLPWNFPLRFESPRDLCCLQPWQHSVCQLCQCLWDHLRTLLLVVIVAKVSNYSAKKKNQDPPQARPPPSWNPESVETRRATRELFQYYVHH